MSRRMQFIQIGADALIPLLGFFLWNWSLYFIVLFYLIDLLAGEVLVHFKAKKINAYNQNKETFLWVKKGIVSLLLFVGSILLIHFVFQLLNPEIDFKTEALAFWNFEDMGIKQGYVLIPLLFLVAFQRYRVEFIFPAKYRTITLDFLWNNHLKMYFPLIAGIGLCAGLSTFVQIPDVVTLFGLLFFTSLHRFLNRV